MLKPDTEDPEPYFWIHPDTGRLEPHPNLDPAGQRRAIETIRLCNLQRPALCTQRAEMLSRVSRWVELTLDPATPRGPLKEEWECLSHPGTEYKLAVRHALRLKEQHELSAQDKANFEAG